MVSGQEDGIMGKLQMTKSITEEIRGASWDQLLQKAADYFKNSAFVYAVMDQGVVLGWFADNKIEFHSGPEESGEEPVGDSVQELRVFDSMRELRVRRTREYFTGRIRTDGVELPAGESAEEISFMEEVQKLWGAIEVLEENWALLTSQRGSRIWVPMFQGENYKRFDLPGLKVRTYYTFPQAVDSSELYGISDERMCGICIWTGEEEKDG